MRSFSAWWKDLRETLGARHEPERVHALADLYWRALLIVAFIVLVLAFLYSTWGLTKILDDLGTALDTSPPPPPALNRSELNATIRAFEERKTQFDDLKTNAPAGINDPSI